MNSIISVTLVCLLLIARGFAAPHPEAHGNDKAHPEHHPAPAHPEKAHPSLAHPENKPPAPVQHEAAHDKHATIASGITPRHEQAHPVKSVHQEVAQVEPVQQQQEAGLFQQVVQIDDEASIEESEQQSAEEEAEPEPKTTEEKAEAKAEVPKDAETKAEASKDAEGKPAEAPKAPAKPREYDVEKVARMAARQVYSGIPGLDVEALMASGAKKAEEPKAPPKPREFDIEKVANRAAYNVYNKLGLWKPAPVNIEWAKAKAKLAEPEQDEEKIVDADLKPKEILVN